MSNVIPSTYATDLLRRHSFAQTFERFISTEHEFVEDALVVTLSAPFGSGKSAFIRMWTEDLNERRKSDSGLPRPIVINAWESDHCGDPLIAMLAAIKEAVADSMAPDPNPELALKLKAAAKDIGWFSVGLANAFVANATGIDAQAAGEFANSKRGDSNHDDCSDILEVFNRRRRALASVKVALAEAFRGDHPAAVIVIDELDRCRPDYAVSYLEVIKHVFDVHGIVFVLCVDEAQLASATAVLFGPAITFHEYYRKFSHRTVRLPTPEKQDVEQLTRAYVTRYLVNRGRRSTALALERGPTESIGELFVALKISPRQAQEVFRIVSHAFSRKFDDSRAVTWQYASVLILMATLRVGNREVYSQLAIPQSTPHDIVSLVAPLFAGSTHRKWWCELLLASGSLTDQSIAEAIRAMQHFKVWDSSIDESGAASRLRKFVSHSDTNLNSYAAEQIENIKSFST